jgi:hypothetical protein
MLWGTSSLALYIPWAGKAGPYLGISLWLWLGVLDAIQGVGLGMILLQVITFNFSALSHSIKSPRRPCHDSTSVRRWHSRRSLVQCV